MVCYGTAHRYFTETPGTIVLRDVVIAGGLVLLTLLR
jgi:hypothetical protein